MNAHSEVLLSHSSLRTLHTKLFFSETAPHNTVGSASTQMKTKTFNPSIFLDEILVISLNRNFLDLDLNYIITIVMMSNKETTS